MKKILLLPLLSVFIVGCVSTPVRQEPFKDQVNIPLRQSELPLSKKNEIFTLILKDIYKEKPFRAWPHPSRRHERTSHWEGKSIVYRGGTNMDYKYNFYIDENNKLIKEISNREWHGNGGVSRDCLLCMDNGFNEYVNTLVSKAATVYDRAIASYPRLISQKKTLELLLANMISQKKVNITSHSAFPSSAKKEIKKSVHFGLIEGKLEYSSKDGLKLVKPYIKVDSKLPKHIKRINYIEYEPIVKRLDVGDSSTVSVIINSAVYDMLPYEFIAKDSNVHVTLKNGTLEVSNRTGNFINIESFTIYWGKHASTLKETALSIPPQATDDLRVSSKFEVYNNPHDWNILNNPRYKKLEDIQGKFPFGIAISYYNVDTNIRKTIFKKHSFSRKDLY
ncbi:hypothetical protein [Parashewanella tropica]|uniref:hypothetical protein n=1 Tax=Parashewanella tropica TaxID=2547970 RepID=UPI001059891A|nr:hypothetical protein [Parashewanella tropica]